MLKASMVRTTVVEPSVRLTDGTRACRAIRRFGQNRQNPVVPLSVLGPGRLRAHADGLLKVLG
jgi:hypothetical protein